MACHHRHTAPHASAPPDVKTDARLLPSCILLRVLRSHEAMVIHTRSYPRCRSCFCRTKTVSAYEDTSHPARIPCTLPYQGKA